MICLLLVRRRLRLPADLGWWWALPPRSYPSEGADDTRPDPGLPGPAVPLARSGEDPRGCPALTPETARH